MVIQGAKLVIIGLAAVVLAVVLLAFGASSPRSSQAVCSSWDVSYALEDAAASTESPDEAWRLLLLACKCSPKGAFGYVSNGDFGRFPAMPGAMRLKLRSECVSTRLSR